MNKTRIEQIAKELERRLSVFFSDKSFGICCGPHWNDRSIKPEALAEATIKTKLRKAFKPHLTSDNKIIQLDYEVRSEQPMFVSATFNLTNADEQVSSYSLPNELLRMFKVDKFINRGVDFVNAPRLWFVIKEGGYYYHLNIYPKFGHGE